MLSLSLSFGLRRLLGDLHTSGFVDLARLLVMAKYGYAEMLGYVLTGTAIGLWIDRAHEDDDLPGTAMLGGAAFLVGAALLTITLRLEPLWFRPNATIEMIVAYAGGVLLLFGLTLEAIRRGYMKGRARLLFRVLVMIGILAFAFYVGQALVITIEDILLALHVPGTAALALPLLAFVGGAASLVRRFYRLYY